MILLYALAAGILAGRLAGGRLAALPATPIAWLPEIGRAHV